MKTNEEYDRVDEDGLPVVVEDELQVVDAEGGIPFQRAMK
jgi:hypothetical protein